MGSLPARFVAAGLGVAALAGCAASGAQKAEAAGTAVRTALTQWTAAFNARDDSRICDLFAADLVYDFRGAPTRGHAAMCAALHRALADPDERLNYAFEIQSMVVGTDTVAVRLIWTSTVRRKGAGPVTTREQGLDVFRREADGRWRIAMFIAYEMP
ncbi:MAG: SgcJ/EcaC family oxidoreductase [Acetobacteraceae bacterium]